MSFKGKERADIRRLYQSLLKQCGQEAGIKAIGVLTTELGGKRVTIPGFRALARELRAKRIQELYDCGFSVHTLARRFGISPRQVQNDIGRKLIVPEDGGDARESFDGLKDDEEERLNVTPGSSAECRTGGNIKCSGSSSLNSINGGNR